MITESETLNQANDHTRGGGLYNIVDKEVVIKLFGQTVKFTYPYAKHKGDGIINLHSQFPWCNSSMDKSEVPAICAQEFELTWGQTVTNLQRLLEGVDEYSGSKSLDTYLTMYSGKPTGFTYYFPHLLRGGSSLREISNTWSAGNDFNLTGSMLKGLKGRFESISGLVDLGEEIAGGILPGFGFEDTQKYGGTAPKTVTVSFPLYNTVDTKSAFKNYCFCLLFAFQNLKTRTTMMTYIPPKLYKIYNAGYNGGIYMPSATVSKFSVEGIGTTRVLDDQLKDGLTNSRILIPEAFKVTIEFQEILSQSSNIMLGSMGGQQVEVINDKGVDKIMDVASNITSGVADGVAAISNKLGITPPEPTVSTDTKQLYK